MIQIAHMTIKKAKSPTHILFAALITWALSTTACKDMQTAATQTKEIQQLKGISIVIAYEFGNKFPTENLEEAISNVAFENNNEKEGLNYTLTRFTHPQTGEIRHVLYNRLHGKLSLEQKIMLASPWVYNNTRAVVLDDGAGLKIDEAQYQLLIQKKGTDMQPIK